VHDVLSREASGVPDQPRRHDVARDGSFIANGGFIVILLQKA